ncbi:tetracycline resistance MFS efflux pump [Viridibacillus sp. FSL R5-0477]|uniref:Tetracycline resistance protein n=1 Tax=Viridibacillus arenosi FSL R5-213 TaxID=1227360 RepID=W4F1A8_9BACL|nr:MULTISPECIES: tetracycline resistance MFS efflux pump [Viridibacillus]ETT86633.1 tetracycline resistance protein [Viridibacillus arenosi FSL R5-213]OMC83546.1 tetracycline resistance MFS efflux pump [Viridibacillus sp. FSL H8-0123]OMC88027.1 tetracycline resistance MFS efflux pump [Viridibacillus arenosi]
MEAINNNASENQNFNAKKAVPVILFFFLFALIIDNSFKLVSIDIAKDLGISATTVSWQATLAGLVIGIGAVVYASLADSINIRTLLSAGIIFICVGSLVGYLFKDNFAMILFGRIIQTAGLASAETLYVIYVTKHLPKEEQKKFLGLSTASYAMSMLIGSLTGGFISTYLHWTTLFLIALLSIVILPFILKLLPKEESRKVNVDVIGLFLIAAIATTVMLYISDFNWLYLIGFAVALVLFLTYINKSSKALIDASFFKNQYFIRTLPIVFIIYSVQLGYIFVFPFILEGIYDLKLDMISLLLIPGYVASVIVGSLSGKIGQVLSSKQATMMALLGIAVALLIPGLFTESNVVIYVLSMIIFSGSFALMYAPLLDTCLSTIPKEKSGTAIGFYNLTINVSGSIGIAYTAAMLDKTEISTILITLSIIVVAAFGLYWVLLKKLAK